MRTSLTPLQLRTPTAHSASITVRGDLHIMSESSFLRFVLFVLCICCGLWACAGDGGVQQ